MRFKVKIIEVKLYKSVDHPYMGWHSDKRALKTKISRHLAGKRLAASNLKKARV